MKRTNFYFPQPMLDALRALSDRTGVAVSEHIRRAIAAYLKSTKE
jgi:predicted DNA-binding protein